MLWHDEISELGMFAIDLSMYWHSW